MAKLALFLILPVLAFPSFLFASEFTLAGLTPDQWVEIRFRSEGCEHHTESRITLRRLDHYSAEVSVAPQLTTATVEITSGEIAQLDRLLAYYRSLGDSGACTTADTVTFVWQGTNIKTFIEPFVDSTCKAPEEGLTVIRKLMKAALESTRAPFNMPLKLSAHSANATWPAAYAHVGRTRRERSGGEKE